MKKSKNQEIYQNHEARFLQQKKTFDNILTKNY